MRPFPPKKYAYYNENDPKAAAWLKELIKKGHIADGEVDTRSIIDVTPEDVKAFSQCHFFAGIGVWSHALRQAGWSDSRPVWTGSCPCQPFSAAGKGKGFADERHLWPAWHWLIQQCRPKCVFGEQVAGKAGETWLDFVSTDLENTGYTCGAAVTAACGFGAPHQRKRLYWVAHADSERCDGQRILLRQEQNEDPQVTGSGEGGSVANALREGPQRGLRGRQDAKREDQHGYAGCDRTDSTTDAPNSFWRNVDWLPFKDEKWRPVEPDTFPLAHGPAARVGRLRGYGNAIVAPQAQAFIESYWETIKENKT